MILTANIKPLTEALEHIENNKAGWNQLHYRWQGTTCFAATVALLAGYKWKREADYVDPYMLDERGHEVHCRQLAIQVLGFTHPLQAVELFRATNTLEDLRRIVQEYVDLAELYSYKLKVH
jgi:hypothetical protein